MKPAASYHLSSPLMGWEQVPSGQHIKELENKLIAQKLKLCFGHHLVKIGGLAAQLNCSDSLINHQINLVNQPMAEPPTGLIAEYDDLPLQNSSVDLVLLTHILEYSTDPHQVLREVHRVLHANGNLVLSVFNPWSSVLLSKLWPFKARSNFWQFRLFSIARIKDWLNLLGFEVTDVQYTVYSSFLTKSSGQLGWWGRVKKRFFPTTGAVCIVTARKREWPLTPIRPRLRQKTRFSPAISPANKVEACK